jgi:hypothetical protein
LHRSGLGAVLSGTLGALVAIFPLARRASTFVSEPLRRVAERAVRNRFARCYAAS